LSVIYCLSNMRIFRVVRDHHCDGSIIKFGHIQNTDLQSGRDHQIFSSAKLKGWFMHVGKEIQFRCGKSDLTILSDGMIELNGKEITINGKGIAINGDKVDVKADKISMKADRIDLNYKL